MKQRMKQKSRMKKKTAVGKTSKKTPAKKSGAQAPKKTASRLATAAQAKPKKETAKKSAAPKGRLKSAANQAVAAVKKTLGKLVSQKSAPDLLNEGQKAPTFSVVSDAGVKVSLKDFADKTVVLYFYPKDDTPGCTQESCDFRDSFARVKSHGAIVLGVSKDSVASHVKFKTKYKLPFTLLSDPSGTMLEAYRVWKEKSMYGRKYMGIDRTTYVIDVNASGQGTIRKVYPKVKVGGHVDQILKDLA